MERCKDCDCEIATSEDWAHPSGCECERFVTLCWGGCDPIDWRERALTADARITELEAELEPTNYVEKTDALRRERDEARAEAERLRVEIAQAGKIIARFCDEECPVNTEEFGEHLPNPQDCERGCPCLGRDIWRVFTAATVARAAPPEKE